MFDGWIICIVEIFDIFTDVQLNVNLHIIVQPFYEGFIFMDIQKVAWSDLPRKILFIVIRSQGQFSRVWISNLIKESDVVSCIAYGSAEFSGIFIFNEHEDSHISDVRYFVTRKGSDFRHV